MKIRVIRNGKEFHVENSVPIALLIEGGILEQVVDEPKPFKPGQAVWRVVKVADRFNIEVSCPECRKTDAVVAQPYLRRVSRASDETHLVTAHPNENNYVFVHCRKREPIPANILEQYKTLTRQQGAQL
jgi:hypothetical protein